MSTDKGDHKETAPDEARSDRVHADQPGKNPKGDPCEFIDPPNILLAKVTHNPELAKVYAVKRGTYHFDSRRLEKMDRLIEESQTKCINALNEKIRAIEPIFEKVQLGAVPSRKDLSKTMQEIYSVAKALDHLPVTRITMSLLKYLDGLPTETPADADIISAHFNVLFNKETLNIKLDPPTKMVLTALEALTDHALATAR